MFLGMFERLRWRAGDPFCRWAWSSKCAEAVADHPDVAGGRKHVLAAYAVVDHIGVGLPLPDPCRNRTFVNVPRQAAFDRRQQRGFGQHLVARCVGVHVVEPALLRAAVDHDLLELFAAEVARGVGEVYLEAR